MKIIKKFESFTKEESQIQVQSQPEKGKKKAPKKEPVSLQNWSTY